ncbi:MAG: alpha-glucan family phosphorylase [Nitrospirota bacterium]|nr:alpha-glucan family phosphorylase [Nitrospirota bacterium]MDP2382044.1 alpha-glucan family phosphorylase [Nitrospirota bacterium]
MLAYFFNRPLPPGLEGLAELALDLRWTWSHATDRLWERLDPEAWERTGNPYFILQSVSQARLEEAAGDPEFAAELRTWLAQRQRYLQDPGWFGRERGARGPKGIAYFSMEFGLGEALPIYSGGLGILAGDFLKTASDLGVPVVGIGLLYQQGYFRQILDPDGRQGEAFPYNDPMTLPITPTPDREGGWLRIRLELPGRAILLRVWQARVGKVTLYLLDSNDLLNSPPDRGATAHLYPSDERMRLTQEIILGIGGWRVLEELGLDVEICHLNEGHAAFAVLARSLSFMRRTGHPFPVALRATRAGNVFTTHTPVEAAFDRFSHELIRPYAAHLADLVQVPMDDLLALGRKDPRDRNEPFNMAFLAMRGSGSVNGVSRLHGAVSRGIFQSLFPGWPSSEVPIGHVTNGVHMPSWDSREADALWTGTCGKERWLGRLDEMCASIGQVSDDDLWSIRASERYALIRYTRRRLVRQMRERGAAAEHVRLAEQILDPNTITLGFARRFASYKRPTLMLQDPDRLARLLCHPDRPVQLIVAGKAHPHDEEGKRLVHELTRFSTRADIWSRIVFLEDYDMTLAQYLVAGIDVWLNTPRRPWEACGTSGMKVLVNGGLNLSELDGWWAEAYAPEVGWALGDGREHPEPEYDAVEATKLYELLEQQVVPEFYDRDHAGIPHAWLTRIRASMSRLTPQFSSNRMVREYVDTIYSAASVSVGRRLENGGKLAAELEAWHARVGQGWREIRFGDLQITSQGNHWHFEVPVYFGDLEPDQVRVELYADPLNDGDRPTHIAMRQVRTIPGAVHGYLFQAEGPSTRPANHFTPRIVPFHPEAMVPLEESLILWKQ